MSKNEEYVLGLKKYIEENSEVLRREVRHGLACYYSMESGTTITQAKVQFYHGSFADHIPGVHHALEHMLFKGKNKEIVSKLEHLGASINAYTSVGITVFTVECSSKKAFDVMPIFAEMFHHKDGFIVDEEEWKLEQTVIQSERVESEADHDCMAHDEVARTLYADGVQVNILGTEDDINRITPADLVKAYNDMVYRENTAFILKHGVYCSNMMIHVAAILNGFIPSYPTRDILNGCIFEKRELSESYGISNALKSINSIDFSVYIRLDADVTCPVFEVISCLITHYIGRGISSPLFTKVRDALGGVYYCDSHSFSGTTLGANIGINVKIHADSPDEHIRACLDILKDLRDNGMTEEEFDKTKNAVAYTIAKVHENGRMTALSKAANLRMEKVYDGLHISTILENMSYGIANGIIHELLNEKAKSIAMTVTYPENSTPLGDTVINKAQSALKSRGDEADA